MPTPSEQLLSRTIYDVDGTTTVWNFSFTGGYIDPSHVKAYTELPNGIRTPIIVTPEMLIGEFQLQVTPALPLSAGLLVIYRDTPKDLPLVDFVEGPLSEVALDTNARQAVFIAAEAVDLVNSTDVSAAIGAAEAAGLSAADAAVSQAAAAVSAADAFADRTQTGLDRTQTGLDRVAVASNLADAITIYSSIAAVQTAASTADTSATNAASSAAAAASSQTAAASSAGAASTSATNAANSAAAASTSAANAANSATAAAGSASDAASSATAAAGSAAAASTSATDAAASATAAAGLALTGLRNLIINGNFAINQRGYVSGTATSGANQYTLDRWRVVTSGQNATFTASANGNLVTAPAGGLEQVIEGASIAGGTYVINWTGTATCTVAGTSRAKGATFTRTAGTNTTVRFTGGTVGNVQVEPGTVVTAFEARPFGLELVLCRRYFRPLGAQNVVLFCQGTSQAFGSVPYGIPMRAAPSVTFPASATLVFGAASTQTITAFALDSSTVDVLSFVCTATGLSTGQAARLIGLSAPILLSAEL